MAKFFVNPEDVSEESILIKGTDVNHIKNVLRMKPGEEIRVPSVAFLFWSGNQMDGHNRFRRFLLEHRYRKVEGEPVRHYLSSGFNYRDPQPFGEYSCITSEWAVAMINRYRQYSGLMRDGTPEPLTIRKVRTGLRPQATGPSIGNAFLTG